MQFKNVIGQTHIKEQLISMVNDQRLPHAQLFLGPRGCGKLALALATAQYINCENKTDNDACGTCPPCIKSTKKIHPDIHFSFPTVGRSVICNDFLTEWRTALEENPYQDINQWLQIISGDANSNKQANLNTKECISIIKKLSLKTFEAKHKILIMWLPEYLGNEGNRLLKLIEEPPENTLFFLVAENQEAILNTILSRCQVVKINALSDEEVIDGLLENEIVSNDAEAKAIAYLASGDFNEAKNLAEKEENDNANMFLGWMRKCYKGNSVELVAWVNKFAGIGRENQKHFLRYGLHFMREYMIYKLTGNTNLRLKQEEFTTAKNLSQIIGFDQVEKISSLLSDLHYHVERNANPKILFLDASITLNKILKHKVARTVSH